MLVDMLPMCSEGKRWLILCPLSLKQCQMWLSENTRPLCQRQAEYNDAGHGHLWKQNLAYTWQQNLHQKCPSGMGCQKVDAKQKNSQCKLQQHSPLDAGNNAFCSSTCKMTGIAHFSKVCTKEQRSISLAKSLECKFLGSLYLGEMKWLWVCYLNSCLFVTNIEDGTQGLANTRQVLKH